MVVRSCFVDPVTFCCWEGGGLTSVDEWRDVRLNFHRHVLQFLVQPMFYGVIIDTPVPRVSNPPPRAWTC